MSVEIPTAKQLGKRKIKLYRLVNSCHSCLDLCSCPKSGWKAHSSRLLTQRAAAMYPYYASCNKNRARSRSRSRSRSRDRLASRIPAWRPSYAPQEEQFIDVPYTGCQIEEVSSRTFVNATASAPLPIESAPERLSIAPPPAPTRNSPFTYTKKAQDDLPSMHVMEREPKTNGMARPPMTAQLCSSATTSQLEPLTLSSLESGRERNPLVTAACHMKFCCQLAHGSPTAIINEKDFNSVAQLFEAIAKWFDLTRDDIIFCTINTFKPDMDSLFSGSLELTDLLFAHIKGQSVEVELIKSEPSLGVTIADNGLGRCFIKRIKESSVADVARPALAEGQLIAEIDGINVLSMRHFEVARLMKNIPHGKTFLMRLFSPLSSGFSLLKPRSAMPKRQATIRDNGTIRFKSNGQMVIEESAPDVKLVKRVNEVLDSYLGVQDDQLAMSLWETVRACTAFQELDAAVKKSEMSMFDFPEEFLFDLWGVVTDHKRETERAEAKSDKATTADDY